MDNRLFGIFFILTLLCCLLWEAIKILAIVVVSIMICFAIYRVVKTILERIYFNSTKFKKLKELLIENTIKCNELNEHLSELKSQFADYHSQDYGRSIYQDKSLYNYNRPLIGLLRNNTRNEHFCSLSVCRNAQNQPFKYLCKYFGVVPDKQTLELFESMFNDFSAAEEGKKILLQERQDILSKYKSYIPFFIRKFKKDLLFNKLGYSDIDISDYHIPKFSFIYISAAGNSSMTCDIVFDCNNLERFITYIGTKVAFSDTKAHQRTLMTKTLREAIKARDNFTCQKCGISILDEPHLLLEIDHIIPISKGGMTTHNNLQTLCWCCNRKKGSKLLM